MEQELISAKLAAFYAGVRYEDLPVEIVEKAKRHILDTFGAGIAGALSDEQVKLSAVFSRLGREHGEAPLWGMGRAADPLSEALDNGLACHTFELDDMGGCDHSGAVVVPAALACLPLCGKRSGRNFITAVVLGYDMARRALESCGAYEPHNEAGWHCSTHAAMDAVRILKERHNFPCGEIASIEVRVNSFVHGMCGGRDTETMPAAQMSMVYGMAAILVYGAEVRLMMDRINLIIDEGMPADEEPIVTVILTSGESYQLQVEIPLGSPQNPMSDEALLRKYRSIAGMIWPEEAVERLAGLSLSLEYVSDMQEVSEALKAAPGEKQIIC